MENKNTESRLFSQVSEVTIKLGIVLVLLVLSFQILRPFLMPVLWGAILAVAVTPGYKALLHRLKGRTTLAASITSLLMILVLLGPVWMLADSLFEGGRVLQQSWEQGSIDIPDANPAVKEWPLIGERLYELWHLSSDNLERALVPFMPQLKNAAKGIVGAVTGLGVTILQFIFAFIVAGVFLAKSDSSVKGISAVFVRLDPVNGSRLLEDVVITIRNVAKGILGVAFIQAVLAGIGFAVAGVPGAGLWALVGLIFGIVQIGVGPVMIIGTIYLFSTASTLTASLFLIWSLMVMPLDNVLKPILLGRGAPVPMLVIFLGALGGFIKFGLIGLFVGAIILSVAYKLFLFWLENNSNTAELSS